MQSWVVGCTMLRMAQHRHRKRVQVTIDPAIWARCNAVGGVSWSQVAELAFVRFLDQVDEFHETLRKHVKTATKAQAAAMLLDAQKHPEQEEHDVG